MQLRETSRWGTTWPRARRNCGQGGRRWLTSWRMRGEGDDAIARGPVKVASLWSASTLCLRLDAAGRFSIVERQLLFRADVGQFSDRRSGPLRRPTLGVTNRSSVRLLGRPIGAVDLFC